MTQRQESNKYKRNAGTYISLSVKAQILIKLNFILYTAGQRCVLIVTEKINKEFIGEC